MSKALALAPGLKSLTDGAEAGAVGVVSDAPPILPKNLLSKTLLPVALLAFITGLLVLPKLPPAMWMAPIKLPYTYNGIRIGP